MAYPTTTEKGIVLIIPKPSSGNYTLTITGDFGRRPSEYPRLDPEYYSIEYSIEGGISRSGTAFRPKSVWTFEARLDLTQQETLKRMEAVHHSNPQAWTIYDYTNPYNETSPATKSLAPSSTSADDGDTVLYYPIWTAEPTRAFAWTEDPKDETDVVSFQFQEV